MLLRSQQFDSAILEPVN